MSSTVKPPVVINGATIAFAPPTPTPTPPTPMLAPLFPEDAAARKQRPVMTGAVMYFPRALAAVANVSWLGNAQHNPGQPLHWAREKSTDQLDAALRHMMEYASGKRLDAKGFNVLAQAAWRILAELELSLEKEPSDVSK